MSDIHGTREELVAMIAGQSAEIERLQAAKRRALAIADERSRENAELRQQMSLIKSPNEEPPQ